MSWENTLKEKRDIPPVSFPHFIEFLNLMELSADVVIEGKHPSVTYDMLMKLQQGYLDLKKNWEESQ